MPEEEDETRQAPLADRTHEVLLGQLLDGTGVEGAVKHRQTESGLTCHSDSDPEALVRFEDTSLAIRGALKGAPDGPSLERAGNLQLMEATLEL